MTTRSSIRTVQSIVKIARISVEDVAVGQRLRPIKERAVVALADSMQLLGQLSPISVCRREDGALLLVTGLHRLEAAKRLAWSKIEAVFATGDEIERELQEIAENLHRSELTTLERDTQIGRWAELTAAKVGQADPPGGAQPAEKGVRKVARELNLERKDVERAVKVASISPEAQQAARNAGLDDNRKALLAVAKEATPAAQIAKVHAISSAKTAPNAKSQPIDANAIETQPMDALNRFAEFCRANLPDSVTPDIPPSEVIGVRSCIAVINKWLNEFVKALGKVDVIDIPAKPVEEPQGPGTAPPAKHELLPASRDLWRDLDIPPNLKRGFPERAVDRGL